MSTDYEQLEKMALEVALKVHEKQTRRDGSPYMEHIYAVASEFEDDYLLVAILHDTVEDSEEVDLLYLHNKGFSDEVVFAVDALTRRETESYANYLFRVMRAGELAIRVKMADIRHNLSTLEPGRKDKRDKYELALLALEERLCRLGVTISEKPALNSSQVEVSER